VRDIFERYSCGRYAAEDIAIKLNQRGVRTRYGNPWGERAVQIALGNVFYLGKVRHRGQVYPGQHTALISQELFDACQEIRERRTRRPRTESTKLRIYPLAGILHCDHCKIRLYALTIATHSYYRCRAKRLGAECRASGKSVQADFMEEEMGKILKSLKPPEGWKERVLDLLKVEEDDVQRWRAEKARLEERLRRLKMLFVESEISETEDRHLMAETKEKQTNLTPPGEVGIDELLEAAKYLETLGPVWEAATPQERKEIYQLVLEVVYVDVLEKKLVEVVPKGAFAPLFGELTDIDRR